MIESKRIILLLFLSLPLSLFAQLEVKPRPSPLAIASCRYKDTYIKITYSQPHKNGREIFGSLVPYGQVWRTGANEATEMVTTKDIEINGALLKAGLYSLFSMPEKEKWTIIFNTDLGLWGSYNYNPKADALRLEVPVEIPKEVYEAFTIFTDQKNDKADLLLQWDKTQIRLSLKFIEPK